RIRNASRIVGLEMPNSSTRIDSGGRLSPSLSSPRMIRRRSSAATSSAVFGTRTRRPRDLPFGSSLFIPAILYRKRQCSSWPSGRTTAEPLEGLFLLDLPVALHHPDRLGLELVVGLRQHHRPVLTARQQHGRF